MRQAHWPVSGDNAARHSSGGHTNAILKNPLAYQPYDPKEIGKEITFTFGPLSGGNHAKSIIEGFGYACSDTEKASVAQFIKDTYSERRKGITDHELIQAYFDYRKPIKVDHIDYAKEKHQSSASMSGTFFDRSGDFCETHTGKDSALAAVKKMIERRFGPFKILNHRSQSDTAGIDANSISEIIIETDRGEQFIGKGCDQDIEISAMKALIDAVNLAYIDRNFRLETGKVGTAKSPKMSTESVCAPSFLI
jgi:2-isopropylmalate synthase